jgi:DNA-binding NarL/FixJ family response regulator
MNREELKNRTNPQSLRILIVDDHDIVREGLRTILQKPKHWVICDEAATGREAVRKAQQHRPDVVVLDFSMPELNGVETTRQIRRALPQTEILILTMHDSEELAREALVAGARGFLTKTDAKRHLVAAVQAVAEHKSFFASKGSTLLLSAFLHPEHGTTRAFTTKGRLTPREREIIQLIAEGATSKGIAAKLGISIKTVNAHRTNMMGKLDLHSVSELVLYAVRNKIVQA